MVEDYQNIRGRKIISYKGEPMLQRRFTTIFPESPYGEQRQNRQRFVTEYPSHPVGKPQFHRIRRIKSIERKLEIAVSAGSLISSVMFFSTNITGFAVSNLNQTDTNILGAMFFVLGILGLMIGLRRR